MADDVRIDIVCPQTLQGSVLYTVSVRVSNGSKKDFDNVSVEPIVLPGRLIVEGAAEDTGVDQLEAKRRRIVDEMEHQLARAYERQEVRSMSFAEKLIFAYASALDVYSSLFFSVKSRRELPSWAQEALRIDEWSDVERLEKDVMNTEPPDSFLVKAFAINKEKLKRCIDKQSNVTEPKNLRPSLVLSPGDTITFPFKIKAPHLLRGDASELTVHVSYRQVEGDKVVQRSCSEKLAIQPSAFAVPTGSVVGAIAGYVIRCSLVSNQDFMQSFSWFALFGSVLLGVLFSLITRRKPEGKQPIVVENFVGGFIVGALTGLFTEQVLGKLTSLFR